MTDYQALIARLESADQTIHTLAEENAALLAANRDLNDEVTGLRAALVDLERQLESARDIAVRCGAFQNSLGESDFEALVDPEGRLFK